MCLKETSFHAKAITTYMNPIIAVVVIGICVTHESLVPTLVVVALQKDIVDFKNTTVS